MDRHTLRLTEIKFEHTEPNVVAGSIPAGPKSAAHIPTWSQNNQDKTRKTCPKSGFWQDFANPPRIYVTTVSF